MVARPDRPAAPNTPGPLDRRDATAGVVDAAAVLLVKFSDRAWVRLLAEHVADSTGHCGGCRFLASGAPVWPCSLWSIARHAEWLASRGRAAGQR